MNRAKLISRNFIEGLRPGEAVGLKTAKTYHDIGAMWLPWYPEVLSRESVLQECGSLATYRARREASILRHIEESKKKKKRNKASSTTTKGRHARGRKPSPLPAELAALVSLNPDLEKVLRG